MPRRVASSSEDDSASEGPPRPSASSSRLVLRKPSRRATTNEDQLEDDEQASEIDVKPAKKRKLNSRQSQAVDQEEDSESEPEDQNELENVTRNVPRHPDGFEAGAIVRIACHNFMTYDFVEFRPGPHLNMVIGPNGTGKSTIVAAIALGLAFQPKDLGRARSTSEFVKHGETNCWIEIELKNELGKRNLTVCRHLSDKDNSSKWDLGGKKATQAEVQACIKGLNVQVDNLCCFLSQEKVYDFAKLDAAGLLKATQSCAGDRRLTGWHQELIKRKDEWMRLNIALDLDKTNLKTEEDVNKRNERDIRRYEQRKEYEFDLDVSNLELHFAKYNELKTTYDDARTDKRKAHVRLAEAESRNEPLHERKEAAKLREKELRGEIEKATVDIGKLSAALRRSHDKIKNHARNSQNTRESLDRAKTDARQDKNKIKEYEKEIRQLEIDLQVPKPVNEIKRISTDITQKSNEIRANNAALNEVLAEKGPLQDRFAELETQMVQKAETQAEKLKRLRNIERSRIDILAQDDKAVFKMYTYCQENQHKMKGTVYKPVRLECWAKNPAHAKYVVAVVPYNTARAIFCTNSDDYNMLNEYRDRNKAEVGFVNIFDLPASIPSMDSFRKPLSDEELHKLGFDCWAIDLIDGPDVLLRYLCDEHKLHRIPICLDSTRNVDEASFLNAQNPFKRWIAQEAVHTFIISLYGGRRTQTTTNNLVSLPAHRESKQWPIRQSNEAEIDTIQREVHRLDDSCKAVKAEFDSFAPREDEIRKVIEALTEAKNVLIGDRKAAEDAQRSWADKDSRLSNTRVRCKALKEKPSFEQEERRLLADLQKMAKERAVVAKEVAVATIAYCEAVVAKTPLTLEECHAFAHKSALEAEASEGDAITKEARKDYDEKSKNVNDIQKTAKAALAVAQTALGVVSAEASEEFEKRRSEPRSVQDLEEYTAELEAKIGTMQPVSQAVVEQYEARKKAIEKLRRKIEEHEAKERKMHDALDKIRNKWEPKLNALVDQISTKFEAAFTIMGCQGTLQVARDDDYDKWGIQIMVAFRDGDPLVALSGSRQSGGERSLSTILYLMSLSSFSTAPFSLVDEINQGMDTRNERAVLNQLVSNVCEANASQYFLITPKLLPNLRYHERMKVLCINNGEWLPEKFNPREYLTRKRAELALLPNGSAD